MIQRTLGTVIAPVVLVAAGQEPPAVVTWLVVQAIAQSDFQGPVLTITGDTWLDPATETRWRELLVPHVLGGLAVLHAEQVCWRVGLRVPDAVAHSGRACRVEGGSADAACFVALIGSALGIKARRDTLVTGTVQLEAQTLDLVQSLPEKLHAAAGNRSVHHFVHAPVDQDHSAGWTPEVLLRWDEACGLTDHRVRRVPCNTLVEVMKRVLPIDGRVIAALRHGQFNTEPNDHAPGWVNTLRSADDALWQRSLYRRVQQGHKAAVQNLLEARLIYDLDQGRYPSGVGACLRGALRTVPAGQRRSKLSGLLISTALLDRCMQCAGESDQDDLEQLSSTTSRNSERGADGPDGSGASPEANVDWLLEQLSEYETAQRIDRALDEARMSYVVDPGQVWTNESLIDVFASFYAHLCRYGGYNVPPDKLDAEAINCVQEAYAREGGLNTAMARAKDHTDNGLRGVLDRMTDLMKYQLRTGDRLKEEKLAIDGRDTDAMLAQTRYLMDKIHPLLDKQLRDMPPELLVTRLPELIHAALNASDKMNQTLRSH
ncbi:MAG: hypothetical protein ACE37H_08050 [Phycisphaeraceae bacterium]